MRKVKLLIVTSFEIEDESGSAGESELYFNEYFGRFSDCQELMLDDSYKVYYRDGFAMITTGMGKINATYCLTRLFSDSRFDFSDAYILKTGCAGGAAGATVMGDVVIETAVCDYDLGHRIDSAELTEGIHRENEERPPKTWLGDDLFKEMAYVSYSSDLVEKAYNAAAEVKLFTTDKTRQLTMSSFGNAQWTKREPKVLTGVSLTGDNYWKGSYGHENALAICRRYGFGPYLVSEMEDLAVATAARRFGHLERLIAIRDVVNLDIFFPDDTPESMWENRECLSRQLNEGGSAEYLDIFPVSRENNFKVGKAIIDRLLK